MKKRSALLVAAFVALVVAGRFLAGGVRLAHGWPYYAVLGLGIGATVLATLRITRVTRRVLAGSSGKEGKAAG